MELFRNLAQHPLLRIPIIVTFCHCYVCKHFLHTCAFCNVLDAVSRRCSFNLQLSLQDNQMPTSRYMTLLQVTVGQEDVEEIIRRDIHRTFPQHPQFVLGQGQAELFNVLKAYSLVDMEVVGQTVTALSESCC